MTRRTLLVFVVILIVGAIWYLNAQKPGVLSVDSSIETVRRQEKEGTYPPAMELVNPSGFLNTQPFRVAELIGKKVILVDFWTYSCINCQRTLPYLNAWYAKYKDKGLEIVGVHSPEFEFEKDRANVALAIEKFGVKYPVVQDNEMATWRAYANRYWPRKYLIDIDGYIVYDHIGEGGYEEIEAEIQKLLKERMAVLGEKGVVSKDMTTPSDVIAVDPGKVASPEVYFGADRNEFLENGKRAAVGKQELVLPSTYVKNKLYLGGTWDIEPEYAQSLSKDAKIVFRYDAKNVYFVASAESPVSVTVKKDGVVVKTITIQADQLYSLIESGDYGEHLLELEVDQPGIKVFTFTFG